LYLRKVNDINGPIGALLHTNTTTNTEFFRNEANLGGVLDLNTELADFHQGTVFLTLQIASGGFALDVSF
jgi:hypothetical protein